MAPEGLENDRAIYLAQQERKAREDEERERAAERQRRASPRPPAKPVEHKQDSPEQGAPGDRDHRVVDVAVDSLRERPAGSLDMPGSPVRNDS